jgi:hypothetical protein
MTGPAGSKDADEPEMTIFLTQHDIDLLYLGGPIDVTALDDQLGTVSVRLIRDRRRRSRLPAESTTQNGR